MSLRTVLQIFLILFVIIDASRSKSVDKRHRRRRDRRNRERDENREIDDDPDCPPVTCPPVTCPPVLCTTVDCPTVGCSTDDCLEITCPTTTCPPITCPCFTTEDIMENCMDLESVCTFTDSLPIQQEIVCENSTFMVTPFNNQCQGMDQDEARYTTNDEFTECLEAISMSQSVLECDTNEIDSCLTERNFTSRQSEDETYNGDAVTSTINIDIAPEEVEGLTLDDIVVSVSSGHTRVGNVLATLSHNDINVNLFGNDNGDGDCGYDNIFVTITDKAVLSPADLVECVDVNGTDINGGAALGFGGENAVIGFGGTRQPLDPLSTLIDQDVTMINGNWSLILNDDTSTSNTGYFGVWEITFVYVNEEVNNLCQSAFNDRSICCDLDGNKALCESTLKYCKSSACLIARDNADNLEITINQLFTVVDLRCIL